jgi:tyrosyl-tRNA synthetase
LSEITETLNLLCRNTVDVIDKADLESRLLVSKKENKPLRIKAGFDPSAPDIHLGHTVLLRKLRQFQDLGHVVVLIIGDTTAQIGDPTGQSKTRPVLTREQVLINASSYQEQAFKVLDKDPKKIEIVFNSKWLDTPEMLKTFFNIAGTVTIDQLLVREDFDKRRKAHKPIALQEMFYPIMQGYDSVAVKSDIEIGGTDQLFNLLMGREIQALYKIKPQIVMTMPLLVGLDGTQKMSKSLGNYIGVTDSAKDIFGKAMSIPDNLMASYFNLLTDLNGDEISKKVASNNKHPREAKAELAKALVSLFYGSKAADEEASEFDRIFRDKQNPEKPDELKLAFEPIWIVDLLKKAGAAETSGDARRLLEQGAVSIDGIKITDPKLQITPENNALLRAGKKKFVKFLVS